MKRWLGPAGVVVAGVAMAACSNEKSPSILDPQGSEARTLAGVWWLMFGLAAAVYVIVAGLILFAILRNRRSGPRESRLNDNAFVVIGGLLVPVAILAVIAFVTVRTTTEVRQPEAGAMRVDVRAHDWWWEVRYPGTGIVTANEIHIPVGRQVAVHIRTADVIHSFWVPQLAGKLDAIPGQDNLLRFTAERAGVYRGECAEFCGIQHANMNFLVIAEDPTRFGQWEQTEAQGAGLPTDDRSEQGRLVFEREACAGCHTIRGTSAAGTAGPDLTHMGSRRTIGAATVPNTTANLAGWIADAQSIKPGNKMPSIILEPADLLALVHYLQEQK
ncbi:MAG: cytochrome c oxidase subunit [Actinomycetota bacterium]|nr:cytochrome c oxidase subunit [Actinomycetota bacterium]